MSDTSDNFDKISRRLTNLIRRCANIKSEVCFTRMDDEFIYFSLGGDVKVVESDKNRIALQTAMVIGKDEPFETEFDPEDPDFKIYYFKTPIPKGV